MLVVGAQVGWLFALAVPDWVRMGMSPESFAVVGMAALFIGVVRAPLTGILLIVELTGAYTLLLPLLAAGATAMLIPSLLRLRPVYEVLKERTLAAEAGVRL
jgi:CIC family chloride channel protein